MKKKHTKKHSQKDRSAELPRYHDMRLVYLTIGLGALYLGIRWCLSEHYGAPFVCVRDETSVNWFDIVSISEDYERFEALLAVLEMFVDIFLASLFCQELPKRNSKGTKSLYEPGRNKYQEDDYAVTHFMMRSLFAAYPLVLVLGNVTWWLAVITLMILLAYFIGNVEGFALPFGAKMWYHFMQSSEDVTVRVRRVRYFFPGNSVIFFVCLGFLFFVGLIIYFWLKI